MRFGLLLMLAGALLAQSGYSQMPNGAAEYRSGDYAAAFPLLQGEAEAGDPVAQFLVSQAYLLARGAPRDTAESRQWLNRSVRPELPQQLREPAQQGDPLAQTSLAICLEHGYGVDKDLRQAFDWYQRAAQQGFATAQVNLGGMLRGGAVGEPDMAAGFEWYRKAAEQGDVMAIYNVGVAYNEGTGVEQDLAKAAERFQAAADRGYPGGQFNLGAAYLRGVALPKDPAKARTLFAAAAEQGYVPAQFNLALMLFLGDGGAKQPAECYFWAGLAERGGHSTGARLRADCAKQLTPEQLEQAKSELARALGSAP